MASHIAMPWGHRKCCKNTTFRSIGKALVIVFAFCAAGCGPLRPFEEFKTGGRTALAHWEYQEALSRLYQTQVLLNLVRMVEFGEAPVHFEFSDVQATITDDAGASLGLSFLDSPAGRLTVGNVLIPVQDNPITATPGVSSARRVQILAKAAPVTRNNWIYDWYYAVAGQMLRDPDIRWYRTGDDDNCDDCGCLDDRLRLAREGSDLSVSYRFENYRLRNCVKIAAGSPYGEAFGSSTCISPPREIGALTTILTLLSDSRPDPAQSLQIPLANDGFRQEALGQYRAQMAIGNDRKSEDYRERLFEFMRFLENDEKRVRIQIAQGAGESYASFRMLVSDSDAEKGILFLELEDLNQESSIRSALQKHESLLKDEKRMALSVELEERRDDRLILPSEEVERLAKRSSSAPKTLELDLLKDILSELRRLRASGDVGR